MPQSSTPENGGIGSSEMLVNTFNIATFINADQHLNLHCHRNLMCQ